MTNSMTLVRNEPHVKQFIVSQLASLGMNKKIIFCIMLFV